ncbi:MAG: caspase family protein [Azospirillaceae bacterium]
MRPRHVLPAAVGLAVALGLAEPSAADSRALVIGINDYADPAIPDLAGAVGDAEAMAGFLSEVYGLAPEDIRVLTDAAATGAGIRHAIETWLIDGTRPGDRVFLHYSGHGDQTLDTDGDEPDGLDEALIPHDAVWGGSTRWDGLITDDAIAGMLARLEGREVTLMVDSCFSGTITKSAGGPTASTGPTPRTPVASVTRLATRSGANRDHAREADDWDQAHVTLWTAADATQFAYEEPGTPPSGLFTSRFIRGVRDRAADANGNGIVSFAELRAYLRAESEAFCDRLACPRPLTPTLALAESLSLTQDVVTRDRDAGACLADLLPAAEAGGLEASLLGASGSPATLRVGDAFRLGVRTHRAGELVVLDVGPDCRITQIFPSTLFGEQPGLAAGTALRFPPRDAGVAFIAEPPLGAGELVVLLVEDLAGMDAQLAQAKSLTPVADPAQYLDDLADTTVEPVFDETGDAAGSNREPQVSIVRIPYRVTE